MDKATKWSSDELEGLRVSEAIRQGVLAERDELRAENERLRTELHRVAESRRGQRERAERAEAEIERLRAALALTRITAVELFRAGLVESLDAGVRLLDGPLDRDNCP